MTAFHLYRSNRVEVLCEALAALLRVPGADPFQAQKIVVGSLGMERWLRHQLALKLGVCANIDFPFPNQGIAQLLDELLDREEDPSPWSLESLPWTLLERLPGLLAGPDPSFTILREYLGSMDGPTSPRQVSFAHRAAQLIDRAIAFRPRMVLAWSAGADGGEDGRAAPAWLRILFQDLRLILGPGHAAERQERAIRRLREEPPKPLSLNALRIFAVSGLPPSHYRFLSELSHWIDVDLFLLEPSRHFLAELRSRRQVARELAQLDRDALAERLRSEGLYQAEEGHPLVTVLGRQARDMQLVIEQLEVPYQEHRLASLLDREDGFVDPVENSGPSALHHLQSDLLELRHPRSLSPDDLGARALEPGDDSIQLHACHGRARQVEILRDVILGLLDDHPSLEPRDIVVLCSDMSGFAPLVEAIFANSNTRAGGAEDGSPPAIPFQITDVGVRRINPIADALLRLLELVDSRVEASEMLDLLALEPVRRRFFIEADQLEPIRRWVAAAGIRWGIDEDHRAAFGMPPERRNTWAEGLDRLALGLVMEERSGLPLGLAPVASAEPSEMLLLGRFLDFCSAVFAELERLREPRSLPAWIDCLSGEGGSLGRLTKAPDNAGWLRVRVRKVFEELSTAAEAASSSADLSLPALRVALGGRFEVLIAGNREQTGAVTFCSLVPMRGVPAQVVCLLGMDDAVFPRSSPRPDFDPVAQRPRAGDRDEADEDRHLLLEALLAARSHLVVLYTGRDERSNEKREPAVPIAEIRELLDQSFPPLGSAEKPILAGAWLSREHPLQPFGPASFEARHQSPGGEEALRPWSFDRMLYQGTLASFAPRSEKSLFLCEPHLSAPPPKATIQLSELLDFLENPSRSYLYSSLGLRLDADSESGAEQLPVELNPRDQARLDQRMMEAARAGQGLGATGERIRAEGWLPIGAAGAELCATAARLAQATVSAAGQYLELKAQRIPLRVKLGETTLVGELESRDGRIVVLQRRPRQEPLIRLLGAWLRCLAWRVQEPGCAARVELFCVSRRDRRPRVQHARFVPNGASADERQEHSRELLSGIIQLYEEHRRRPLPLFPHSSFAFARNAVAVGVCGPELLTDPWPPALAGCLDNALYHARSRWNQGDLCDPSTARVWAGAAPWAGADGPLSAPSGEVAALALRLWGPLLSTGRWSG